jgi:hypothetical protein
MNEINVLSSIIYAAQFSIAATIICIGVIVLAVTAIALNQLFHKYWLPVNVFKWINENIKQDDTSKKKVPPTLNNEKN